MFGRVVLISDLPTTAASSEGEGSSSCALSTDSSDAPLNIQSLISVLKAPKHSELSYPRRVTVNPKAKCPRRSSASSSSDPQSVTPSQWASSQASTFVFRGENYSARRVVMSFP